MIGSVWLVFALTLIIHGVETLSYAVRLAGIRTGKLAVALSLTGIIVLISRTSNMLQGTLFGNLIDKAKHDPDIALGFQFHLILIGASVGTLVALLVFPTMVFVATRLIARLEVVGSLPILIRESVTIDKLKSVKRVFRLPRLEMLSRLRVGGIPKRLLLMNTLVTGIYTVGVLSALYASYLVPENATSAAQSSGLINGIATILLTIFIDPRVALLSDKAISGKVKQAELHKMFGILMLSRLAGTLLAQLLLLPGAKVIAFICGLLF
ncbi:lipid II flippase Amj family protein [Paenibacillus oleatilyticus]|uniref:lipid II flippase Amj family protein n=1 Tax=Paenibacillus oleatilyticus TaxID=2594886 RepID=UPI001C1F441E|nr:lipid II flippase Amj family protein [Paenibacillus oleatilyticus]MBU7318669.1 lipid II flippase Amj family protein [Paenibacillus oleatilyticus]